MLIGLSSAETGRELNYGNNEQRQLNARVRGGRETVFKLKTNHKWHASRLASNVLCGQLCSCPQIQTAPSCLLGSLRLADRDREPVREQEQCSELPGAPQHLAVSIQPDQVRYSALLYILTSLWEAGLELLLRCDCLRFFLPSLKIWTSAAEYVEFAKEQVRYQEHRKSSGW